MSVEAQITYKRSREKPAREKSIDDQEIRDKHLNDKQLGDKQLRDKQLRDKQLSEKRRESRRPADGVAQVEFSNPRPVKIQGRLMDVSPSGFRMAHGYTSLAAGQVVEFSHSEASGSARVMWNRILDQSVQTGFLVLAS